MKRRDILAIVLAITLVAVTACATPKAPDAVPEVGKGEPQRPADGVYPGYNAPLGEPSQWSYKGTIRIPHVTDMTGPAATSGVYAHAGLDDWFKYVNEYLGGVRGYKMEWNNLDSKFEPELMINAFNRFIDEGNPVIMSMIAYVMPMCAEIANKRHVPYLGLSGSVGLAILDPEAEKTRDNYHFQMSPVLASRMAICVNFVLDDWNKKGKAGKPRIGTLNMDNEGGHEAATAVRIFCEQLGADFTIHTFHPKNITDAIAQVSALKKAKVDYIITGPDLDQPLSVFGLELERQQTAEWDPKVITITDWATVYLDTLNPAFEGHYTYEYCLTWDDVDKPIIKLAHQLNEMWHPEVTERPFLYVAGVETSIVFCELYKRIIDDVGLDAVTGEKVREILESFDGFDPLGIGGALTYNRWDHQGSHSLRISQCRDGRIVPVTGMIEATPLTPEQRYRQYWLQD